MSDEQSPCRKFLELREFRININHLGDTVKLFGRGSAVSVILIPASRIDNLHVLKYDILDRNIRNADNPGRRNIPRQILDRTFVTVAGIGFSERYLDLDVG